MPLLLDAQHIARLHADGHVGMEHYVDAVERAYRDQGEGKLQLLPRQNFWIGDGNAANRGPSLKLAAAILEGVGAIGVPMYTAGYRPGAIDLWIALFSAKSGDLLAHLHGQTLSLWKTGATAAVATRHMARPDAATVGMIGTGQYARTQLMGLAAVRPLRALRCYSRRAEGREAFAAWAREKFPALEVSAVDHPRAASENVDILVTVTTSRQPVVEGAWISPGTHCNLVGMHYPGTREVDSEAIRRSRVVVDDLDQAWGEKGEIMMPFEAGEITRDHVVGNIGSVIAGKVAGRRSDSEITVFCSGGTALEYVGCGMMLHERALAVGIGQVLEVAGPGAKP
ncbi:MAG: ornithine cyclodeaminase family protein [Rhodospirillaceae bacterium]|nr:ornithine cyclodeaminase family protein [Rhodospirillaceae bacterium]